MEEENTIISKITNPVHSLETNSFLHIIEFVRSSNYRYQFFAFHSDTVFD